MRDFKGAEPGRQSLIEGIVQRQPADMGPGKRTLVEQAQGTPPGARAAGPGPGTSPAAAAASNAASPAKAESSAEQPKPADGADAAGAADTTDDVGAAGQWLLQDDEAGAGASPRDGAATDSKRIQRSAG